MLKWTNLQKLGNIHSRWEKSRIEAPLMFQGGTQGKEPPPLPPSPSLLNIHTEVLLKMAVNYVTLKEIVTQILEAERQNWMSELPEKTREGMYFCILRSVFGGMCFWTRRHILKDSKNLWVRAVTLAGKKLHLNAFWLERITLGSVDLKSPLNKKLNRMQTTQICHSRLFINLERN